MFGSVISIVANLCTIAAFAIAVHLWRTWKKQQNYSFTRDKIFEAEIAVVKLYTVLMQLVELNYKYRLQVISFSNTPPPEHFKNLIDNLNIQVIDYLKTYDLAIYTLEVLELDYSSEVLIHNQILYNNFHAYMEQMHFKTTTENLIEYFWKDVTPKMFDKKKLAMTHLSELRKSI